jgi:hypothetical protein
MVKLNLVSWCLCGRKNHQCKSGLSKDIYFVWLFFSAFLYGYVSGGLVIQLFSFSFLPPSVPAH